MLDVGTLQSNGSKFDSSRDRGQPFVTPIGVGRVIKGWDEGVPQLSLGQKARLICTPDYAYGARGFPPVIPANSTLIFEVSQRGSKGGCISFGTAIIRAGADPFSFFLRPGRVAQDQLSV